MHLPIIPSTLLPAFLQAFPPGPLAPAFEALQDAELSTPHFSFYTSVASVFSSKIEGESIELDSYIKHKRDGLPFQPDLEAVFFYAAMLHLVFVKIHPWNDGNGRSARLLEKWFLAEKLGPKAWFIQSEKRYYRHRQLYYQNIRRLGLKYETLDYDQALPFLCMLPGVLAGN